MLRRLRHLLEMIRFSHTVFALPFALLSAILAWRENAIVRMEWRWRDLLGILLCMVFARSAAMTFNRLADRQFDSANPRTATRHLPSGTISVRSAYLFWLGNSVAFVLATLLFLPNQWPVNLSVPVLAFLCGYSYAKRFTAWSHYWLAAALMLSPVAVWIALRAEITWTPAWIASIVFFWVGGFDIIYACQDTDFDRRAGLFSLPARWTVPAALRWAMLSHACMVVGLIGLWYAAHLGAVFLGGIALVALLLAYEHWLVKPDDLSRVNVAFFQTNAVISIGLLVATLADLWLSHVRPN